MADDVLRANAEELKAIRLAAAKLALLDAKTAIARAELQLAVRQALINAGASVNDEIDDRTGEIKPRGRST
jgi:hypothetical protein